MVNKVSILISFALLHKVFVIGLPETTESDISLEVNPKPETPFSSHYLSSLDHKIENMLKTLNQVDLSIKQLQEKAHTWAIFHHHIDSWNDQIKTIEHKIDLIRRTQDENQVINQKLTSQEFTLNHILSKVVYLSDSCNRGENENVMLRSHENNFGEVKKLINGDRKIRNEIGTRLSNILRHIQNIERDNCRSLKSNDIKVGVGNKMARLMHPIKSCNGSKPSDNNIELREIEKRLSELISSIPVNDLRKMIDNDHRDLEKLGDISDHLAKIDDRTIRLFDADTENHSKLSSLCQSMSSEITTFTGSSDLLLKKFEKLVLDVQKKVDKLSERENCVKEPSSDENNREDFQPGSESDEKNESSGSEEKFEVDKKINGTEYKDTDDVEEIDNDSKETEEPQEEINFVQQAKTGCHELSKRVDGIYKFSTLELNEDGRDINERYCVFSTDGPAWTVMQNRGPYMVQESFNRSWNEYRNGFGSLEKDFWWGNEFIHQLTYADSYELRIELEDFENIKAWVEYSTFRIDTEGYNYNLIIDGYRGAIPDAMTYHNDHDFSTYDRRNDKTVDACCACATGYSSGWWFNNCAEANLNGVFRETPLGHNYIGIVWDQWHGDYSLKSTKMMLRPKNWTKEGNNKGSSEDP